MKKKFIPLLVLGTFMLVSCGKEIPEDIIQPAAMEELLYDYHFAVSLGSDLHKMRPCDREALKEFVFEKHHVTRAEFDSSMIWYTRHAYFLHEIYSQLDKRYTMEETQIKTQINKRNGQIQISLSGDSVDVWSDRDMYWLSNAKLTNKVLFDLKADTTFRASDALALEATFTFFSDSTIKASDAVVGLNFNFKDGKSQSLVETVQKSGPHRFYLKSESTAEFNNVTGFIYCTSSDSIAGDVLVNGIKLIRFHDKGTDAGETSSDSDIRKSDRKRRSSSGNTDMQQLSVQPAEQR